MTTALSACRIELSKQLNDYWASSTTSSGDASSLIDTSLKIFQNAWINKWTWDLITDSGHTREDEERIIASLDNSTGDCTLTVAHTGTLGTSCDYEIHRLFSASEKRQALIAAARMAWPYIHEKIWDESLVSGNWLKDGSFEMWDSATALTHWSDDGTVILAKTSTSPYYKQGVYSCGLGTAAGYIHQDITDWDGLKHLAGKTITFTVQGYCAVASTLRIAIYDGTTTTYSDHRTAEAAWTEHSDPMSVTATIQDNPTAIEFHILLDTANTAYVDDARVIGPYQPRLLIDQLGLAQEKPVQVLIEPSNYSTDEPWIQVFNSRLDTESGYLYLPSSVQRDRRLRIKGIGYLDFLDSDGVSATAWDSTININSPQTDILIAQAIVYLYTQMSLPNFSRSTRQDFQEMLVFWELQLRRRIGKHGMEVQSVPVRFQ